MTVEAQDPPATADESCAVDRLAPGGRVAVSEAIAMVRLERAEWLAVLQAWQVVRNNGWSSLQPAPLTAASAWAPKDVGQLEAEAKRWLDEMNMPSCQVRVFWKRAPAYSYLGCNEAFARDAGVSSAAAMDGLDDFAGPIAWKQQAAKYRADDERVVASGKPLLDILERQTQRDGVVYVRTGKAPLVLANGYAFGILGMYEVLDEATARRLFQRQMRRDGN